MFGVLSIYKKRQYKIDIFIDLFIIHWHDDRRMRIFEHRIFFLSLLAGKSATVEQMLLTESIKRINGAYVLKAPGFFFSGKS